MSIRIISLASILQLFLLHSLLAQVEERGASISHVNIEKGRTKAIIIGVSDYKELPLEKQLAYADNDAMAFYYYLTSVEEVDTTLVFLNQEANANNVYKSIYKALLKDVDEGDQVIIYFAGHGDVDSELEDGFLLFHEVENDMDYAISDALQISDLQKLISAAAQKGVQTLLITDACRSGKIVGNENGTKNTITALAKEWENTLKLVSCQPNQLSYEGSKWGGGHGAFTYHLLSGFAGLADENENGIIEFGEAYDYVKRKVKADTENKQIPKLSGDETVLLFETNAGIRENMISFLNKPNDKLIAYEDSRSLTGDKSRIPESGREDIKEFEYLLKKGKLLRPEAENKEVSTYTVLVNPAFNKKSKTDQFDLIAVDTKEKYLAHSTANLKIKLYDLKTTKILRSFKGHYKRIVDMEFSHDNQYIASIGEDNLCLVFDLQSYRNVASIELNTKDPHSICFSPDNNYLAVASESDISFYHTSTWKAVESMNSTLEGITSVCFTNDESTLLLGTSNGKILVYDFQKKEIIHELNEHRSAIREISFIADKNVFLCIDESGKESIWKNDIYRLVESTQYNFHGFNNIEILKTANYQDVMNKLNRRVSSNAGSKAKDAIMHTSETRIASSAYAFDLFEKLQGNNELVFYNDKIVNALSNAFVRSIDQCIKSLTNGEGDPHSNEISEAIRQADIVLGFYTEDDFLLSKKLQVKKAYLEAYQSIVDHDFEAYDASIEKLQKIIEMEPNASFTYNALSLLYQMKNDYQKATEYAHMAIAKSTTWSEPKKNLGDIYTKQGDYTNALSTYEQIIEQHPESSKGYRNAGDLHLKLGDFKKAGEQFAKSLNNQPQSSSNLLSLARLELNRGRFSASENLVMQALELDEQQQAAYLLIGDIQLKLYEGNQDSFLLKKAIDYFAKGLEYDATNAELLNKLATCYRKSIENNQVNFISRKVKTENKNSFINNEIKRLSETALKSDPYNYSAYENLAFADKNRNGEMLYWERIKKDPENKEAYFAFAGFYASNQQTEKAIEYYRKAIEKDPKYLDAYLKLWDIYEKENNQTKLSELYTQSKKYFPGSPIFHYKQALVKIKNKQDYSEELEKAIAGDKDYSAAVITKQILDSLENDKLVDINAIVNSAYYDYIYAIRNMMSMNNLKLYNYVDVFGYAILPQGFPKIDKSEYQNISNYRLPYDQLLIIEEKGFFGVTDYSGSIVIPLQFDKITRLENDLFKVQKGDLFGIYDYRGVERVAVKYFSIRKVEKAMMREYYQCELKKRFDFYNLYGEYQFNMQKPNVPNYNYYKR
jgi:tetratricopeptide (TPR) repeat protein/WD40 repeat protein